MHSDLLLNSLISLHMHGSNCTRFMMWLYQGYIVFAVYCIKIEGEDFNSQHNVQVSDLNIFSCHFKLDNGKICIVWCLSLVRCWYLSIIQQTMFWYCAVQQLNQYAMELCGITSLFVCPWRQVKIIIYWDLGSLQALPVLLVSWFSRAHALTVNSKKKKFLNCFY